MSSGYNRLLWGFLLVILDLRIIGFDLLIDAVGYFIVVSGLKILSAQSESFKKAQVFGVILGILSIPSTIDFAATLPLGQGILPTNLFIGSLFYSSILGFLHIVLAFCIFRGMIDMAIKANLHGMPKRVQGRARFYIITSIIIVAVMPLLLNLNDETGMYVLFTFAFVSFIVELFFILLIREFRNSFRKLEKVTIIPRDEA
ncbi:hypothetical protein IMZ08_13365 [Bacillus luteolus]|uniref:Uncharacterized protein n=1 Tax=Litchfieldia luteola TaxID=682179 RepID=A0ABR9QKL9_9BACI|nr:hypothetical protein [Cytobacillus luteolus]MBE4909052.1 hypothetical protein [Cytobacillus luteolus]MBP1941908.1 hypothetical protein [Cytobacillus luteolus]